MVSTLCLICGGIGLVLAAGEFVARDDYPGRHYLALCYCAYGALLIQVWAVTSNQIVHLTFLLFLSGPIMFLHGWAFSRYLRHALGLNTDRADGNWRAILLDTWPCVLAVICVLPYVLLSPPEKLAILRRVLSGEFRFTDVIPQLVLVGGLLYQAWGVGLTLVRTGGLANLAEAPTLAAYRVFAAAVVLYSILGVGLRLSGKSSAVNFFAASAAVLLPLFHLLGRRNPHFLQTAREEFQRVSYERSRLKGVDLEDLQRRLRQAIEQEQIFTDETLTLETLAARLAVTPHQLSEYFNARLGTSFPAYLSARRVELACQLLEREPERTVLAIAYDVGFGAKSTFNTAFRAALGVTPSEYRRQKLRKIQS